MFKNINKLKISTPNTFGQYSNAKHIQNIICISSEEKFKLKLGSGLGDTKR